MVDQQKLQAIGMCAQTFQGQSDSNIVYYDIIQQKTQQLIRLNGIIRTINCLENEIIFCTTLNSYGYVIQIEQNQQNILEAKILQQIQLSQKPFCADVLINKQEIKILIGMASRTYTVFQYIPQFHKVQLIQESESPLRHQASSACWFNNQPFLGSVEGRVASSNLAFRAHKKVVGQNVLSFPVNQILNYKDLYLFTCGSDGAIYVWNIEKKRKIFEINEKYMVRRILILRDQKAKADYLYTFQSYDWSQGSEGLVRQEIAIKQYIIKQL